MTEEHEPHPREAPQQAEQGLAIGQGDAVQERIPDRQRRMVQGHHGWGVTGGQDGLQPGQLPRPQGAVNRCGPVAVQQQHLPVAQPEAGRGDHRPASEHGLEQAGVIVIAGQQRHRPVVVVEQPPQLDVAPPALVVAEIAADQQQIRGGGRLLQLPVGLLQTVTQTGQGLPASHQPLRIRQQMGITQLQNPPDASHGLDRNAVVAKADAPLLRQFRQARTGLSCHDSDQPPMASIPPGSRQRCSLCQAEIQGMVGGRDVVHFSQGAPATRAKLWARVCQYLRTAEQQGQCLNQDPSLRGEVVASDYYAEAPVIDLGGAGGSHPLG